MEETLLPKPKIESIVSHTEDEISRPEGFEEIDTRPATPQKAQLAFYRPFIPDPVDEQTLGSPERSAIEYHDAKEISIPHYAESHSLPRPPSRKADSMFYRPGIDNVPSY
uniref:ZM domain-containing protein n=1 Tax=Parastrongyloides trichosuri TaxID=131310 RepID=A0A0N4ZZ56_PARTI